MKYITETYNLIMDSKINPLSKIPNLQVRHLVMQLLAYMWSLIFGIYIVESIYAFGISALAHSLLIVAIIVTKVILTIKISLIEKTKDNQTYQQSNKKI